VLGSCVVRVPQPEDIQLVALAASVNDLDALAAFFRAVPDQPDIAYVVVADQGTGGQDIPVAQLASMARLPVRLIEDGTELAVNTVFLVPADKTVELHGAVFRTAELAQRDSKPLAGPVDRLFTSLCGRDWTQTIAVVLSGDGADGVAGAQQLHQSGAMILVPTSERIAASSTPGVLLGRGISDRALTAGEMPSVIQSIFASGRTLSDLTDDEAHQHATKQILDRIETIQKVDFGNYNPAEVNRCIQRRLLVHGHDSFEAYNDILSQSDEAVNELFEDMLIGVTAFYRDQEAIEALRVHVLDLLAEEDHDGKPLKIWVPACASGEEVYTIAIELSEALRAAGNDRRFRIIGTDVSAKSVEIASRSGFASEHRFFGA